jgi:hypothetical protein
MTTFVHFVLGMIILGIVLPPIDTLLVAFGVACLIAAVRSVARPL